MTGPVAAFVEWLAATGAPNGLVLLFALTRPATWSRVAVEAVRERLGGAGGAVPVEDGDDGDTSA